MPGPANSLNISQPGLVTFDGVSIFSGRTLQAGTNITITNPDGIAGDPIINATGGGGSSVSFSAHSSTNNSGVTGDGTIILITPDLVDQTGTDYNAVSGTFTCSTPGFYQFNATIGLIGLDGTNTNLRAFLIYTNFISSIAQQFFFANLPALSITDSTTVGVVTGSMLLPMAVGDTIAMYVNVQGITKNVGTLGVNGSEIYCQISGSN